MTEARVNNLPRLISCLNGVEPVTFESQVQCRWHYTACCVRSDTKWRNPDLREVIDYLSHEDDLIKANAAAYLQHLTYMDDNIKAETR